MNADYYIVSDPPGLWLQCRVCHGYVQLKYDGVETTNATVPHDVRCPVAELEQRDREQSAAHRPYWAKVNGRWTTKRDGK